MTVRNRHGTLTLIPLCPATKQQRSLKGIPDLESADSSLPVIVLDLPIVHDMFMSDGPQSEQDPDNACGKGDPVCFGVTLQSVRAISLAARENGRMVVEDRPVAEVEYVPAYHGRQSHEAPVHREAMYTERVYHHHREDAEKGAVSQSGEPRDEEQEVGILDFNGTDLRDRKNGSRGCHAPEPTHVELFD